MILSIERGYGNSVKTDIKNNEDLNKSLIATLWAAMIIMYFCERAHTLSLSLSNERTNERTNGAEG